MAPRPKVLFLEPPAGISAGYRHLLNAVMNTAGLTLGDLYQVNLHKIAGDKIPLVKYVKQGNKWKIKHLKDKQPLVARMVAEYVNRFSPDIIVCNDPASLALFNGGNDSVSQCRGSVYNHYPAPNRTIKVVAIDDIARVRDTNHGRWVAVNDWRKIARWLSGTVREEPGFNYSVAHTLADVLNFRKRLLSCFAITTDIETHDDWILCIGYTGVNLDGTIHQYIIPFFNPHKPDGAHWDDVETEEAVWRAVRDIHWSDPFKILQNGAAYDSAFFIKYRCPLRNFFCDTLHMWNCTYAELPKRLDFISSICVDHYAFWKEESKGDKDAAHRWDGAGLERFWRYCALDNYFTTLSAMFLLPAVFKADWIAKNYSVQFALQLGPALTMQCRGMRVDFAYRKRLADEWRDKLAAALRKIQIMVDNKDFNPGSPDHVGQLLYTVLRAKKVKVKGKEGATDELTLKMLQEQHIIVKIFTQAILDYREAAKLNSTYWSVRIRRDRFYYSMLAAGAETSRFASGKFLWEGGNVQNLPELVRGMFVSDPGQLIFDIDLTQSDAYYIAYTAQDKAFIATMESGKDTHVVHAAHFFKEDYDSILRQVAAGIPKYAHKVTGIRALTKRIVHGSNFQMAANTLFTIMGRDAVIAAALAIGKRNPHLLTNRELIKVCDEFLEGYHVLYPRLRPWYREIELTLAKSHMLITAYGWARVFFGASEDARVQREATAFVGQGGTAGNINQALLKIFYGYNGRCLEEDGVKLFFQGHDSLVGTVPENRTSLLRDIQDILELPCTIHGRTFKVPTAVKVGHRWGDENMHTWKSSML